MQRSVGDILKQEDSHVPANHRPDRRRGFNRVSRQWEKEQDLATCDENDGEGNGDKTCSEEIRSQKAPADSRSLKNIIICGWGAWNVDAALIHNSIEQHLLAEIGDRDWEICL